MIGLGGVVVGVVMAAQALGAGQPPMVVLECQLPKPMIGGPLGAGEAGTRIFRIGQGHLEEWSPLQRRFGGNLCDATSCTVSPDRSEGSIGTASAIFTVGLDRRTGRGYWRAIGATGFKVNEGVCRQIKDPSEDAVS
jgi:hypothetical protein